MISTLRKLQKELIWHCHLLTNRQCTSTVVPILHHIVFCNKTVRKQGHFNLNAKCKGTLFVIIVAVTKVFEIIVVVVAMVCVVGINSGHLVVVVKDVDVFTLMWVLSL